MVCTTKRINVVSLIVKLTLLRMEHILEIIHT